MKTKSVKITYRVKHNNKVFHTFQMGVWNPEKFNREYYSGPDAGPDGKDIEIISIKPSVKLRYKHLCNKEVK